MEHLKIRPHRIHVMSRPSPYTHQSSSGSVLQRLPREMEGGGKVQDWPQLVAGPSCPPRSRALVIASVEIVVLVLFLVFLGYRTIFSKHNGPMLEVVAISVSAVIHLVVGILLLHAARQLGERRGVVVVWAWAWVRVVLLATDLAMVLVQTVAGRDPIISTCILAFCVVSVSNIIVVRYFVLNHLEPVDGRRPGSTHLQGRPGSTHL
nr:uncharacterized protein LOC123774623 [Procambarus clarkii]